MFPSPGSVIQDIDQTFVDFILWLSHDNVGLNSVFPYIRKKVKEFGKLIRVSVQFESTIMTGFALAA